MGDVVPFPGGGFTAVTPPELQEPYLLRLRAAFAGTGTTTDTLLIFADMAEEASLHAEAPHRLDWHALARLLRAAAPAFADVRIRPDGLPMPPAAALHAAARSLRGLGFAADEGAARVLELLAGLPAPDGRHG